LHPTFFSYGNWNSHLTLFTHFHLPLLKPPKCYTTTRNPLWYGLHLSMALLCPPSSTSFICFQNNVQFKVILLSIKFKSFVVYKKIQIICICIQYLISGYLFLCWIQMNSSFFDLEMCINDGMHQSNYNETCD
jgi:hypothetical protein